MTRTAVKWIAVTTILLFLFTAIILAWQTVFAPRFEDQRREQFEHSRSHREAVVADLTDRCTELATAKDPDERAAIVSVIVARASVEDLDALTMAPQVRACVDDALYGRIG